MPIFRPRKARYGGLRSAQLDCPRSEFNRFSKQRRSPFCGNGAPSRRAHSMVVLTACSRESSWRVIARRSKPCARLITEAASGQRERPTASTEGASSRCTCCRRSERQRSAFVERALDCKKRRFGSRGAPHFRSRNHAFARCVPTVRWQSRNFLAWRGSVSDAPRVSAGIARSWWCRSRKWPMVGCPAALRSSNKGQRVVRTQVRVAR